LPSPLALFDRRDDVDRPLQFLHHRAGGGFVLQVHLFPADAVEFRQEGTATGFPFGQFGLDGPVLFGDEVLDFPLPFHDHADGDGLDPSGAEAAADFAPEERAQAVADQSVQDTARLLGVDQVHINPARVGERLLYGRLGDFVEDDPAQLGRADAGDLGQMPGNGLPLPVRVGGQIDLGGLLDLLRQFLHHLLFLFGYPVGGLEVVLHVYGHRGAEQVPDVAHRGADGVALAQESADGAGLGGGLHDDQPALRFGGRGRVHTLVGGRGAHTEERRPADRAGAARGGSPPGGEDGLGVL